MAKSDIKKLMADFFPALIIISVFTSVVLGAHYFLYFSFTHFFPVTNPSQKIILAGILFFLAISFFLSSFLSHWQENPVTRAYYFISGFWLGLLTNLILASILTWIIILAAKMAHLELNRIILSAFCLLLAGGITLYGVWNAFNPRLKNITVTIPHLPDQWKNKKIVQLSDVHLGQIYREKELRKNVQKINAVNPEMVVITGDLFDGMDGDLSSFTKPLGDIVSKLGTFFVTGNHETYLGLEETFSILEKYPIKILKDEVVDVNGLKLIGINYPERGNNKDIVAILRNLENQYFGKPNILLYHSPVKIEEIKNTGINLELCGHTHKGQFFPFDLITNLLYHGYDYGLHKIGNYSLYTTSGTGTWGPAMRIGNVPEIVVITLN